MLATITKICIFNHSWEVELKKYYFSRSKIKSINLKAMTPPPLFNTMGGLSQHSGIEVVHSTNAYRILQRCQVLNWVLGIVIE